MQQPVSLEGDPDNHGLLLNRRRAQIAIGVGLAILVCVTLRFSSYYLFLTGDNFILHHEDDVQYYLKIAQNLSHGSAFTFDGMHPTNGFHPLWVIVLQPLCWIFHQPQALVRASFISQYIIFLAAAVLLYLLLLRITGRRVMISLAIALYFALDDYFYKVIINGLETPLFVLLLFANLLVYMQLLDRERPSSRGLLWAGLLTGLLVLSRLDGGIFHATAFGLCILMALLRRRITLGQAAGWATAAGLPVLAFFALSAWYNGSPVPISGQVKSSVVLGSGGFTLLGMLDFPNLYNFWTRLPLSLARRLGFTAWAARAGISYRSYYITDPGYIVSAACLAGLVYIVYLVMRWFAKPAGSDRSRGLEAVTAFSVSALLLVLFNKAMYRGGILAYWYPITFSLAQLVMWGYLLSRIRGRLASAVLGCLIIGTMGYHARACKTMHSDRKHYLRSEAGYTHWYGAAQWLHTNTPPDAIAAAYNAGITGFYSERRVINLDGLVNSHAYYQEVLKPGFGDAAAGKLRLLQYLQRCGVRYFADLQKPGDQHWLTVMTHPGFPTRLSLLYETPPAADGWCAGVYEITYPGEPLRPPNPRSAAELTTTTQFR